MVDEGSREYFRQRERMERAAAKSASSEAARRVHQELAQGYSVLSRGEVRQQL
jgi:hypothetical protein